MTKILNKIIISCTIALLALLSVFCFACTNTNISYDVVVNFNEISDDSATITYDIENGFSPYTVMRDGYNFVGLSYEGTVYTPITYFPSGNDYIARTATLSTVVTENNGLEVNAVWDCTYPEFVWGAGFNYITPTGTSYVAYYDGNDYIPIEDCGYDAYIIFEDKNEEYYAQLEDSIFEYFYKDTIDLDNLYALVDGSYQKVTLSNLSIAVDTRLGYIEFSGTYDDMISQTFKDIIDMLDLYEDAGSVTTISVNFDFE